MTLRTIKSKLVRRVRTLVSRTVEEKVYDSLLLQGRIASWQVRSMKSIQSLQDVEFKVLSQWGEDGIIDWLIERAGIPSRLHTFVEFGVENYSEANTRFLIENRNWRGLIMDGDPALTETLRRDHRYYRYDLTTKSAFITRENINDLITEAGFAGEIGLLSIDVDGNDYWIWEAIDAIRPVICVCEYNAVFGDLHPVSIPYDPKFSCGQSHSSRLYFGASIAALSSLAARKGYRLLGTTMAGNDAFFIREDYAAPFDSALKNIVALPSKFRCPTDASGQLSWIEGYDRFKMISDLPVVNTETGESVTLGELGPVYSDDWLSQIAGSPME
jgi:hypothetical protein